MIAVQIEAPIVNHRIDFSSERLPPNVVQAKNVRHFDDLNVPVVNPWGQIL